MTAIKVSSCGDCGTLIIGERLRCPACHDLHAARVVASHEVDVAADAVTAPRSRQRLRVVNRGALARRVVVMIEVLGIVALALVLLVKGCS